MADIGKLKVQCFKEDSFVPIDNCKITVTSVLENNNINIDLVTDSSGLTNVIELAAPPIEYSENPSDNIPYSLYDLEIKREGFEDVFIRGVQVFPEETALQNVRLIESNNRVNDNEVIITGKE